MLSDGEATLVAGNWAIGEEPSGPVESWMPFRAVFDVTWAGRRHVMMSPVQIDQYGNANISCIGEDFHRPKVQLLGVRGAPGNTVSHPTSYWVSSHDERTFVEAVDMVAGVGYDRAEEAGKVASRYLDLRRVVSPLGVFDFSTPHHRMRVVSLHPGVALSEVVERTGFKLEIPAEVPLTRNPTAAELQLLDTVFDPEGVRNRGLRT
jgi:acyl CoA:acetate/3-ketoacid CoA transferase beta subunit